MSTVHDRDSCYESNNILSQSNHNLEIERSSIYGPLAGNPSGVPSMIFDHKSRVFMGGSLDISTKYLGVPDTSMKYLENIWVDINNEAEAIVISNINYKPTSLSNIIYEIIDNRDKRRRLIRNSKKNKIPGLYSDFDAIRSHRDSISKDEKIMILIQSLFKKEELSSITPIDGVFLNSYYRRLLRAKLERNYIGKELIPGLIITNYANSDIDAALVETMRLLRVICKFLGISSTTHEETFSIDKLYMPNFWASVSAKLVNLFGETRITVIEEDDPLPTNNVQAVMMHDGQKEIRRAQVLMLLNMVFNTWSGSILIVDGKNVKIIPATYVSRMLPKLM